MKAMIGLFSPSLALGCQSEHVAPAVTIRVDNAGGLEAADLAKTLQETADIFCSAGIRLLAAFADAAYVTSTPFGHIRLRLVRSGEPAYGPEVLGLAPPDRGDGAEIIFVLDHVARACQDHAVRLPILLSHVVAHELGHVLLGTGPHMHSVA
jgi:hypothetical protein